MVMWNIKKNPPGLIFQAFALKFGVQTPFFKMKSILYSKIMVSFKKLLKIQGVSVNSAKKHNFLFPLYIAFIFSQLEFLLHN